MQPTFAPAPFTMARRRGVAPRVWIRLSAFILLLSSLILWLLAYQAPLRLTIPVGGDVELRRRFDDAPFLSGVNGSEPGDQVDDPDRPGERIWWWELRGRTGARPYRWTTSEATLLVPGAGGGLYAVEL
ncbi:MAG: hypothetical protein HGA45_43685, partial [Chloroflexales bacterium]|nr:hypothetical protein [Chloroflexales bacterium]